jgi:hypothetical protein
MYKNFGRQRSGKATKYQKEIPCFSTQRLFTTVDSGNLGSFEGKPATILIPAAVFMASSLRRTLVHLVEEQPAQNPGLMN